MESVGAGGGNDKGGIDFSLANLCRCMCFTHEDTEASDSKVSIIPLAGTQYLKVSIDITLRIQLQMTT